MNHCLYEFCLPKQTANSLKARAFFIFSCLLHSTSMKLVHGRLSLKTPWVERGWAPGPGSSQTGTAEGLGDGTGSERALDGTELAWPPARGQREDKWLPNLEMEGELARTPEMWR